ncbi:ABC transporter substrate-binding protein [Halomonas sp. PAMB 3232]|uniref:ABC transporter substrate-binding protein n=2 Tax=unclassified Halomonas TaxID=2609666 RepID=UPI00289F0378|nr:ABC transporter substrate-binding protein [Halomonas sp. PAMB 3232]WNL39254.1 ABC transporter substrate-binding protein [Halomonas sp. PAMB 3232]
MMLKRSPALALAGLCVSLGAPPHAQAATAYPLTLESCGHEITLEKAPARVVTIGQAPTEMLYLLGLEEHVAGTSLWVNPVLEAFAEANADVERLSDNAPSFESVLAQEPDLVISAYEWMVGPAGVVGTPAMFDDAGVPLWTLPTECVGKDNHQSMDGARERLFDPALVYQSIETLAEIFDVVERGENAVSDLQARETAAIEAAQALDLQGELRGVFWYSSADLGIDPYVAGVNSVPDWMMTTLGIDNVVRIDQEWPTVGWESIARADPTFIAAARMDRRRFPADDIAVKREFLQNDPVTRLLEAVEQDRLVEIDAHAMDPSIRSIYALETLVEALAEMDLSS